MNNLQRAQQYINCYQQNHPNTGGCCCFGPTGPTGPQGEIGPTGPAGADALTPTITIGTVTTGAPGTDATAELTGTAPNYTLNLTIPQGPTGPAAA